MFFSQVFEDAPIGTTVIVVSATDSDVGINAQITYSLGTETSNEAMMGTEHEFIINPQTGAIITNKLLDREALSGNNHVYLHSLNSQHHKYIFHLMNKLNIYPNK